jgi:hypothetical protein
MFRMAIAPERSRGRDCWSETARAGPTVCSTKAVLSEKSRTVTSETAFEAVSGHPAAPFLCSGHEEAIEFTSLEAPLGPFRLT